MSQIDGKRSKEYMHPDEQRTEIGNPLVKFVHITDMLLYKDIVPC
jgi:hypothetical protein